MDYEMLNNMKIEELKKTITITRLRGLKVTGKCS